MKICVWRTGHEIADTIGTTVFDSFLPLHTQGIDRAFPQADVFASHGYADHHWIDHGDIHIGYGILRGMDKVFAACDKANKPWFNIDKGYLKPHHYNGYYRISLRGTQHTQGGNYADYERLASLDIGFRHWRGLIHEYPVLICPPTDYVCKWLPEAKDWLRNAIRSLNGKPYSVRWKDKSSKSSLEYDIRHSNYVLTFNSSVGWEALRLGVPCISDVKHSLIGSYFGHNSLDKLNKAQDIAREELFATMSSLQMTLVEIKSGFLWPLMSRLLSTSGLTVEKQ